uniref:Uncharacterized protein MANES_14G029900 n=1 Tax=Rhizophora mucronata TaxID=61149 RepID=A0A2P2L9L7_RHIMU
MGCGINTPTLNPPILCKFSGREATCRIKTIAFSSSSPNQEPISTTTLPKHDACAAKFKTLGACKLGISMYPDFEYNAQGGTGTGIVTNTHQDDLNNEISISFDLKTLYIPPLTSATTKFLGFPLPPPLRIDISPELFQGTVEQESGKVQKCCCVSFHTLH